MAGLTSFDSFAAPIMSSKLDDVQEDAGNRLFLVEQGRLLPDAVAEQDQPGAAWRRSVRAMLFLACGFASFAVLPMAWFRSQPALQALQLHQANTLTLAEVMGVTDDSAENANISTSKALSKSDVAHLFDSYAQVKGLAQNTSAPTSNASVQNASVPTSSTSSPGPSLDSDAQVEVTAITRTATTATTTTTTTIATTTATSTTSTAITLPQTPKLPSLFCFALVMPQGPELALIKSHFMRRAGIFGCNDQVVFSSGGHIALGVAGNTTFHTLPVPKVVMTKGNVAIPGQTTNSWLNTKLFTKVFEAMLHDGRFWMHDWVVKVDPDAVFFPDRLRKHIAPLSGRNGTGALYVRNCGKNPYIHLMGAIEVFSKKAMQAYFDSKWKCESQLSWQGWGEDYYMEHCLNHLGVRYVNDYKLLGQASCEFAPCQNGWVAAFHPFKDVNSWWDCWNKSTSNR
mmetsp:Transcript_114592/g.228044  ORF Transcript_114592/g.228044 Transcript_114592/m.228044 type:complete len:455 (-) Transcript_114592:238-1602(-)